MLFISDDESRPIQLTIIGAGPVGLACLLDLLRRTQSQAQRIFEINVVEKRDLHFSRGQKIIMIEDESENKGLSWIDFCKRSFFPGSELSLSAAGELLLDGVVPEKQGVGYHFLQKIIRQKVHSEHPVNVSIKQLQNALLEQIKENLPPNVSINWFLKSTVSMVDTTRAMIRVSSEEAVPKEIFFHALINCEGEKRQTVPIIHQAALASGLPMPFQYEELESLDSYHMAVKIKIKPPDSGTYNDLIKREIEKYRYDGEKKQEVYYFVHSSVFINRKPMSIIDLPFLFDPNTYKQKFYEDNWVPKYFVAGLIPREIHEIKDAQEKRTVLLRWASYLLAHNFNLAPENFIIDAKDNDEHTLQQRAQTFTAKIKAVIEPVLVLPNQSVIVLLGDACMSPYYWEGISSTIGLNEALAFLDCIFLDALPQKDPYEGLREVYKKYQKFVIECLADNSLETQALPSSSYIPSQR